MWMEVTEKYSKGFDLDLKFGKLGEEFVRDMQLGNRKIEVKTERDIWKTTGNIAIELRYKGVIEGGFMFKVDLLKEKIKKLHKSGDLKMVMGGDNNMSQMALLPINDLF